MKDAPEIGLADEEIIDKQLPAEDWLRIGACRNRLADARRRTASRAQPRPDDTRAECPKELATTTHLTYPTYPT